MEQERLSQALAGRYRIERLLGEGGMATVWLAHDERHGRRVAIKVMRPELAAVIGASRFLAEIRTTATLQHPHILSLFDSGEVDGTIFYVMPFVDGESLRDRLERERQLPVDDAVRIAREVADALHHAHGHGVVHRDVKPENILLQGGHALVADFGIALAASRTGGTRITETGMSLGTPQYMSPEQAMGERALDARTDVYALGCVLYEMLTGEPPFTGPTAQAIVARVITEEPRPITGQRRTVPPHVVRAVEVALSKLPADRFATAAAFAAALGDPGAVPPRVAHEAAGDRGRSRGLTGALALALLLVSGLAAWGWLRPRPEPRVSRAFVRFAPGEEPVAGSRSLELLADGSALLYIGAGAGGTGTRIWMKRRHELRATPVNGTEGAVNVFPSPDGAWLGFVAGGKLKKVPIGGGDATTLADVDCSTLACVARGETGSWLEDERIVFYNAAELQVIPANGGTVQSLVTSAMVGGQAAVAPSRLPGSRGLLLTSCTLYCNRADVRVLDFATDSVRVLVPHATLPRWLPSGHLFWVDASGTAQVAPFDAQRLALTGPPTPVLERVAGAVTIASDGTLAYLDGDPTPRSELVIVDRDGAATPVDTAWRANFASLAASSDGRRIAVSVVEGASEDLWIKSLDAAPATRLTFGPGQRTTPTWSADGSALWYTHFDGDSSRFLRRRSDGTSEETVVQRGRDWVIESAASRDGAWLVTRGYHAGERNISARRLAGDTTVRPVVTGAGQHVSPALSPDGRFLAYVSGTGGESALWVVPFPDASTARWQIALGAREPAWSPDGRTLLYVQSGWLTAVDVSTAQGVRAGTPRRLFPLDAYRRHPTHRAYDVLRDGRFLMIRSETSASRPLVLVDGWFTELAARLRR